MVESFRRALESGDLQGLLDVLAPDVVYVGDGGGVKQSALRPVMGSAQVARLIRRVTTGTGGALVLGPTVVNGSPALSVSLGGEIEGVMAIRV